MARYQLGQPVRLSTTVRDISGVLANAGTITLTVLKPDLTTQVYASPSTTGTGLYHQDIPAADLTQTGHYQFKWVSTGANAGVSSGAFDVVDPFAAELLSLDDAKEHLQLAGVTAARGLSDAELELYIDAATEAIEAYIGPVGRRTVAETVYPSSGLLLLRRTPVLALTSVTPYLSAALAVGSLTFDPDSGIVYPGVYTGFWSGRYDVVYVAGRASVPASVSTAARMLVKHLAETQRGAAEASFDSFQGGGEEALGQAAFSYLVAHGVRDLLDPYRRAPAVA